MKPGRIDLEAIERVIRYDPEQGRFYWKVAVGKNVKPGMETGANPTNNGYRYVDYSGVAFPAQRLAWFMFYGSEATSRIKFKDGDKRNVRIDNLVLNRGIAGTDHQTPEGRSEYQRAYRAKHRERFRHDERERKYGVDPDSYRAMLAAQGGKCAICKGDEPSTRGGKVLELAVDHNHTTGVVRDLLCSACNKMIGLANEDRERLLAAVRYLDKHEPVSEPVRIHCEAA